MYVFYYLIGLFMSKTGCISWKHMQCITNTSSGSCGCKTVNSDYTMCDSCGQSRHHSDHCGKNHLLTFVSFFFLSFEILSKLKISMVF